MAHSLLLKEQPNMEVLPHFDAYGRKREVQHHEKILRSDSLLDNNISANFINGNTTNGNGTIANRSDNTMNAISSVTDANGNITYYNGSVTDTDANGNITNGRGNKLYGRGNITTGDNNSLFGDGNVTTGNGNVSRGNGNVTYGDSNTTTGNGNITHGNGHVINGNGHITGVSKEALPRAGTHKSPDNTEQAVALIDHGMCKNCAKYNMAYTDSGYQAIEFDAETHIPHVTDDCTGCTLCHHIVDCITMVPKKIYHTIKRGMH